MNKRNYSVLVLLASFILLLWTLPLRATPDKAGVEHPLSAQIKHPEPAGQMDDYPQMPGFPTYMGVIGFFSPCEGPIQVDIDGDGDLEIFAGATNNSLYGWHHDGAAVLDFPIATSGPIQSSPAAGDIDGDGDLEILVGNRSGDVCAFHHNGTSVTGWPQHTFDEIAINSVALWDFDNDGDYEVLVASDRLYVWQGNGTLLPGFPANFTGNQYGACSSSSVGDIDGDGDPEIIVEGWDYLNAFHHSGTMVQGWPYPLTGYYGFSYSAPSLVDIDGDGDVEIFCAAHESGGGGWNSELYGLDGDGTNLPGFPQFIQGWTYSTPAIGDLDGDNEVEISLLCNSNLLYAFNPDGSSIPGWPLQFGSYNCEAALVMADIDNDGMMEVFFGNNGGTAGYQYYCYRADGSPHPDFPFTATGATMPTGSAIADADGDGDLEIAHHTNDGAVNLWDAPYQAASAARPWPQPHHDVQHTGNYHFAEYQNISVSLEPYGTPIVIPANGGSFEFNIEVTNNESNPVTLQVWTMATLPNGREYGPIIGPVTLTLSGGQTVDRDRTQAIGAGAPPGDYTYDAYVGMYPNNAWDEDHFDFTKSTISDGGPIVSDWNNWGECFPGEKRIADICNDIHPSSFILHPSLPNPFNPETKLTFTLPQAGSVSLIIYDIQGREVVRLVDGWISAGTHERIWNAAGASTGIYFARLASKDFHRTQKLLLIK